MDGLDWAVGLLASSLVAAAAWWKKRLTRSGSFAAVVMGTTMYALGTVAWFGTLLAFFFSSTLLSSLKRTARKRVEQKYAKSANRDAGQVLANGGAALLACIAYAFAPQPLVWYFFVGTLAAVNADTWATELGAMSRREPRSILHGRKVARGTSGGISPEGLLASAAGGLFIGAVASVLAIGSESGTGAPAYVLITAALGAGLIGSLFDSWLGARWQVMYRCHVCEEEVETVRHCQQTTRWIRGSKWMTNDAVNFFCSLCGGTISVFIAFFWI